MNYRSRGFFREESDTNFARKGSALRAASKINPRNRSCPTCGEKDVLTPEDVRRGYQCDDCANRAEGYGC